MKTLTILLLLTVAVYAAEVSTCFVPGEDCAAVIVKQLDAAKKSVYVQAYGMTSAPIAKAIVAAHKRGVHVEVILDRSNRRARYSALTFLLHAGIAATIDAAHAIAHNKVMVIDEATTITGSFNFTMAAQKSNAENVAIIHDAATAAKYLENWRAHRAHAEAE